MQVACTHQSCLRLIIRNHMPTHGCFSAGISQKGYHSAPGAIDFNIGYIPCTVPSRCHHSSLLRSCCAVRDIPWAGLGMSKIVGK